MSECINKKWLEPIGLAFYLDKGKEGLKMKQYLTAEGKKELEKKLELYKTVKRKEAVEHIKIARDFGDLSENSEYDAAKEEQGLVESEIREMEEILRNCEVIDPKKLKLDTVSVGVTVVLYDDEFKEKVEYKIVGSTESDPNKGIISNASPVGKAVLGHKVGDIITVTTPGGSIKYKIKAIKA